MRRVDGSRSPAEVGDQIRATLAALRFEERSGVIVRKTPEQIEAMAAAGDIVARCLNMLAAQVPARRDDRRPRPGGREVHPRSGRRAGLQGLSRLPGLDLHLAELDGGARHPR